MGTADSPLMQSLIEAAANMLVSRAEAGELASSGCEAARSRRNAASENEWTQLLVDQLSLREREVKERDREVYGLRMLIEDLERRNQRLESQCAELEVRSQSRSSTKNAAGEIVSNGVSAAINIEDVRASLVASAAEMRLTLQSSPAVDPAEVRAALVASANAPIILDDAYVGTGEAGYPQSPDIMQPLFLPRTPGSSTPASVQSVTAVPTLSSPREEACSPACSAPSPPRVEAMLGVPFRAP